MCVIDETIAFMGGLDACFGRWDTPQHILIDNGEPDGAEGSQIWIGSFIIILFFLPEMVSRQRLQQSSRYGFPLSGQARAGYVRSIEGGTHALVRSTDPA